MLRIAEEGKLRLPPHCNLVISCFFSKHFSGIQTKLGCVFTRPLIRLRPSATFSLREKARNLDFPTLSRGERVSAMCRQVRGHFTAQQARIAAPPPCATRSPCNRS